MYYNHATHLPDLPGKLCVPRQHTGGEQCSKTSGMRLCSRAQELTVLSARPSSAKAALCWRLPFFDSSSSKSGRRPAVMEQCQLGCPSSDRGQRGREKNGNHAAGGIRPRACLYTSRWLQKGTLLYHCNVQRRRHEFAEPGRLPHLGQAPQSECGHLLELGVRCLQHGNQRPHCTSLHYPHLQAKSSKRG